LVFGILGKLVATFAIAAAFSVIVRRVIFERWLQWKPPQNAAILITGTSTGFGRLFAHRFASQGIQVFAGVRKKEDGDVILNNAPEVAKKFIVPIILDVTKQEQCQSALQEVRNHLEKNHRQLFALINNAGIQSSDPLETQPISELRNQIEVNVIGQAMVSQAFIPLLRNYSGPEKPRILFVGSTSGFTALPFSSAYAASKHAVEALADALRVELSPWNIKVMLLEPGLYNTNIFSKFKTGIQKDEVQTDQKISQNSLYPAYAIFKENSMRVMRTAPTAEPVAELAEKLILLASVSSNGLNLFL